MSRTIAIQDTYAAWGASKGARADLWTHMLMPDFVFRTSLGALPQTGFRPSYAADELQDYFQLLDDTFQMVDIKANEFIENEDMVMGLMQTSWIHKPTGKPVQTEVATIWKFNGDKAASYRELFDTSGVAAVLV